MATAISVANFEAALGECYDAIRSEDWESAANWYAAAEAQHAGLAAQAADGAQSLRRREALTGLGKAIEKAREISREESRTGGLITTKLGHG